MRRFQQGETIFFQGDPGQALYLIEAGRVRIYVQDDGGQETSVIFYSAGDIFGELAVIDGLPRSASAIAADETIVHVLSRERLRAHLLASPQLAYNFMQALAVRRALLDAAGGQPDAARCARPAGAQTAGTGAGAWSRDP